MLLLLDATYGYAAIAMEGAACLEQVRLQAEDADVDAAGGSPAILQTAAPPPPAHVQLLQSIRDSGVGDKLKSLKARGLKSLRKRPDDAEESVECTTAAAVPRVRSVGATARDARLRAIIDEINETSQPLQRTPSARRDLAVAAQAQLANGVDPTVSDVQLSIEQHAARNQRLRKQLRLIDAEIAECNADLQRAELLRGDASTTARYQCDADCIVGGCGEQFAANDGVRCADCNLFLCFPCVRTRTRSSVMLMRVV